MPITLDALAQALRPSKTALVLGAGASVPSGGPTDKQLAEHLWKSVAKSEALSEDLMETATILERNYTRRPVVDAVIGKLQSLQPTGGLLGLPKLGWERLFTTNFDRLAEIAYSKCNLPCVPIRSNFDFSSRETAQGTRLFKLHGCITQDESRGDKASMLLTEHDYERHWKYRQVLFANLTVRLLDGDVLIIGQSLKDRHLDTLIKEVLQAKGEEGAPGVVYVLVYERDDLRAPLLEDRGARIAFAGIDEFVHAMAEGIQAEQAEQFDASDVLPLTLISTVIDASADAHSNVTRMFNGGPATFGDIKNNVTFERSRQVACIGGLLGASPCVTIVGAAGVGKTTFARQLGVKLVEKGIPVWEHRTDFLFQHAPWRAVEAQLRADGRLAVLILDECAHYLRQTNALVDYLAEIERPGLKLILTANAALWAPRLKSPNIYKKGIVIDPLGLEDSEINSLINLVQFNSAIATLVQTEFKKLPRPRQFETLRQKCSADMFVCLKNIFANESLDTILLREYDDLDEGVQDYYRYVAALEAVGARVHRQLVMRMLHIPPQQVGPILRGLAGIIDEYDIQPRDGIYGWRTRHLVIARKITDYKFSSLPELAKLFREIVEYLNPSVPIELQTVRDICDVDFGIGRLADGKLRQELYRRLTEIAPAERIPWHRLIRERLYEEDLEGTEYLLRDAEAAAGADAPIDRYKVRLMIIRSKKTVGISEGDRVALLRKAFELAMSNTERHKWDKYSFYTVCDAAVQLIQRGESTTYLEEALALARTASERISDPEMTRRLRDYDEIGRRVH